jgi:hypothetical protein
VLAIRVRIFDQRVVERSVAVGNQLVARQGFKAMQRGIFPAGIGLVVLHRGADGLKRLILFPAQFLGQEADGPLAGDLCRDALGGHGQGQQIVAERQLREARRRLVDQPVREFQHTQGFPAQIAAAGA